MVKLGFNTKLKLGAILTVLSVLSLPMAQGTEHEAIAFLGAVASVAFCIALVATAIFGPHLVGLFFDVSVVSWLQIKPKTPGYWVAYLIFASIAISGWYACPGILFAAWPINLVSGVPSALVSIISFVSAVWFFVASLSTVTTRRTNRFEAIRGGGR